MEKSSASSSELSSYQFKNVCLVAYTIIRQPEVGDVVVLIADQKGKARRLEEPKAQCECERCASGCVGTVMLKQKGKLKRTCVRVGDVARLLADATPLHRAVAASEIRTVSASEAATFANLYASEGALPVLPLHIGVEKRRKGLLRLIAAHPEAAKVKGYAGYPLRAAIRAKQESLVIEALCDAYPHAASVDDPLHLAIRLQASDSVVAALLRAHPDSARSRYSLSSISFKKRRLAKPTVLAAAILSRTAWFANMRCTCRAGGVVADLMEVRSAPASILDACPDLVLKLSDDHATLPLALADAVGLSRRAPALKELILQAHIRAWYR